MCKENLSQIKTLKTKKRFLSQIGELEEKVDVNFESLLKNSAAACIQEGQIVKGVVTKIYDDFIVVDVGLKSECRISLDEFDKDEQGSLPKPHDVIDVFVERLESKKGTVLSHKKVMQQALWTKLQQIYESGADVIGTVTARIKGGFSVDIERLTAFLPGSQLDVRPLSDEELAASVIGIEQRFKIVRIDKETENIVVSRRMICDELNSQGRAKALSKIVKGDVYQGKVKNITPYGAFVSLFLEGDELAGIDGLLHLTDISYKRLHHPSERLHTNQIVTVVVISCELNKIALGMKQLGPDPWRDAHERFSVGQKTQGTVTNVTDYGAFVELDPGIEGLVHASEMTYSRLMQDPRTLVKIGDSVSVIVLDVESKRRRISLSIKQCHEAPHARFAKDYPVGSPFTGLIRHITNFALFVQIYPDLDGMVHALDISHENGQEQLKNYNKGDKVVCQVLSIEDGKVALGIKQLMPDSRDEWFNQIESQVVTTVISEIVPEGIRVRFSNGLTGFIKRTELSSTKADQKPERFAVGNKIDAKVTQVDRSKKEVYLSVKELELDKKNEAIERYGSADSGAVLSDVLSGTLNKVDSSNNIDDERD